MNLPHNKAIVGVGFWLAVAILVGIGVFNHQTVVRLLTTSDRVTRVRDVTDNLQQIFFNLQEVELQTRALVTTDDMTHERARLRASSQIYEAMDRLREITGGTGSDSHDIEALAMLTSDRLTLLDQTVQMRNFHDGPTALQFLDSDRNRAMVDQIIASFYRLMDNEHKALLKRDDELKLKAETSVAIYVIGCFLSLGILFGVFLYLNTQIAARRLAEEELAHEKELLERQYSRQSALAEIELAINQPHELQTVLDRIAKTITHLLPTTGACVILWDPQAEEFVISTTTVELRTNTARELVRRSEGASRWVIDHKQILIVPDIRDDPFGAKQMLAEHGLESYVGVPLLVEGDALGVLYAFDQRVRVYQGDEMEFLQSLATRAALAISKVRLYDKLQDMNRLLESHVRERTTELIATNEQLMKEVEDHRRDEQALRESEERYRDLIEGAYDMVQSVAPDGRILSANRAWLTNLKYTEADLPGLSFFDILHPESAAHFQEIFARLLEGESAQQIEAKFVTKDNRLIDVEGNATVLMRTGKVVAVHGFFRDITARKHAESALHELSGRLLLLQDQERRHIARELHDVTAQNLSAITLNLARLEKLLPQSNDKTLQVLTESINLAEECLREIRTLSYVLHPPMLDEYGLPRALEWYLEGFAKRSGIHVDLRAQPAVGRLTEEAEMALFRIVQESLTNIRRHSGSRKASIELTRTNGLVTLKVEDDGQGFREPIRPEEPATQINLGVGITGMRERLRQLGGQLDIVSGSRGTTVLAVVPVNGENT